MYKILLLIGGFLNLLLAIMHLMFWKLFDWPGSLKTLSFENLNIMQVLNIHLAFVILAFAFFSIVFPDDLYETKLGRTILFTIFLFYILRIINEFIFWEMRTIDSYMAVIFCGIISVLYGIPLFKNKTKPVII